MDERSFCEVLSEAAKQIYSREQIKPTGSYLNPYIIIVPPELYIDIKLQLDHNGIFFDSCGYYDKIVCHDINERYI